jgi:hypothetical protein
MLLPSLAAWLILAAPAHSGPTLAAEDTMHTQVPEVLVHAPRVTLDEILDRVARGEAHRDSLIRDQAFTIAARLVSNSGDAKKASLISEEITRVYKKKPDHVRGVVLRRWQKKPPKKGDEDDFSIDFRSDTSEEIVNFAFRPRIAAVPLPHREPRPGRRPPDLSPLDEPRIDARRFDPEWTRVGGHE